MKCSIMFKIIGYTTKMGHYFALIEKKANNNQNADCLTHGFVNFNFQDNNEFELQKTIFWGFLRIQ